MSTVCIKSGEYRNQSVINKTFNLVKGFQTGKKGGYVTVKNEGNFPSFNIENVKIKVSSIHDIEFTEGPSKMTDVIEFKVKAPSESDEQAMDRIATRFAVLDEMSKAAINGDIRAMIVSGPPGVGKSYGVELQLEKASMFDKLANKKVRFASLQFYMTSHLPYQGLLLCDPAQRTQSRVGLRILL